MTDKKEMMDRKYSLLVPAGEHSYRTLSSVVMHDLGLDAICRQLTANESEQNYIMGVMSRIYADPTVTKYRCGVFDDIIGNKQLRDDMMKILGRISFLKDYGSFKRDYDESSGIWDLMHRLDEIGDYIDCVDSLYSCLKDKNLNSVGFTGLKEYVQNIYEDNGFSELKRDIAELKKVSGDVRSITIGINLNNRFEADGVGLISVNSKQFTRGGVLSNFYEHLVSRDKINDNLDTKSDFKFQPLDAVNEALSKFQQEVQGRVITGGANNLAAGMVGIPDSDKSKDVTRYTDRVVTRLITRIVKRMREILNKYVSITITDMTDLIPELTYYIRWAEYIEKLQERGAVFSKARVVDSAYQPYEGASKVADSKSRYYMKARGVYNIKLAAFDTEESDHIVANEF